MGLDRMPKIIFSILIEAIKYYLVFSFLLKGKIYKDYRRVFGIIILLLGLFTRIFLIKKDSAFLTVIFIGILYSIMYQGNVKNKVVYFLATLIGINYVDTICYSILSYISKGKFWWYYIYSPDKNKIIEGICVSGIIILISLLIKNKRKDLFTCSISLKQWGLLLGAMVSFYVVLNSMLLYMLYRSRRIEHVNRVYYTIIVATVITITCIIAFFIYSNYLKQQNDMHLENVHLYDENLGLRLSYYDQVQGNYEKVRQFRHDFRHHLAAIEGLIQGKEYSELEDYVVQLSKQDVKLKNERMRYTGNYMIDAIIVGIVANDNFKDVDFQFDGMLPTKIRIRDMDICGVLANGLENALEACMKNNDRKIVALKAGCFENIISFQIKNTYDSKLYDELSKGRFDSTKTDDGHGYGIRNMQRIVKEYNGKLEYSVDQEWVTADIYMQQKDENQPSETTNNQ